MAGVSGVGGTGTAELMKVLENSMQANIDLAEKIVKLANSAQVSEAEATGLGNMIDLYG